MKDLSLPVIPLRNITVLPGMVIQIDISRKKSIMATMTQKAAIQDMSSPAQKSKTIQQLLMGVHQEFVFLNTE